MDFRLIGQMGLLIYQVSNSAFGIQVYKAVHILCKRSPRKVTMKMLVEKEKCFFFVFFFFTRVALILPWNAIDMRLLKRLPVRCLWSHMTSSNTGSRHLLAASHAGYLTSLCPNFLICKIRIIKVFTSQGFYKITWVTAWKEFWIIRDT